MGRPIRSPIDPLAEQRNFMGRQAFAFRRHAFVGISRGNSLDQGTGGAVPGDDGGLPGIATAQRRLRFVHPIAALLLLRAMATDAVLRENRLDVARKITRALRTGDQHGNDAGGQEDALEQGHRFFWTGGGSAVFKKSPWF